MTDSMRAAIGETDRRRVIQAAYNVEHDITPQSIIKQIDEVMSSVYERDYMMPAYLRELSEPFATQDDIDAHIRTLRDRMKQAAANLDFEQAASLRDDIKRLRDQELGLPRSAGRA
jgi:excinuclease ABC subunit B